MTEYKKTFQFGKVAYTGKSKSYLVELDVTLEIKNKKPVFSASGHIWNSSHTDWVMGGQCIDDIYNEFKSQIKNRKLYVQIMRLWEDNHLNDMHAGCKHQRAMGWDKVLLDESKPATQDNMAIWTTPKNHKKGLLTKKCPTCSYKYGTSWIYEPIPRDDMIEILNLLDIDRLNFLRLV